VIRTTLVFAALLAGGCTTQATAHTETAESAPPQWTRATLRRLDPVLRDQVREGERGRIAIKVFFLDDPGDDELAALLLSRVGHQAIGRVALATLLRIASRDDVDHIEALTDVGY
jgi:hypothetical protein